MIFAPLLILLAPLTAASLSSNKPALSSHKPTLSGNNASSSSDTAPSSNDQLAFQAPLAGIAAYSKYPGEYIVTLHKNHTLDQHFRNIGQNLTLSQNFRQYSFSYQATMNNETRDERVRRDPGVRLVEVNAPLEGFRPELDVLLHDEPFVLGNDSHLSKRAYGNLVQKDAPWGLQMLTSGSERLPAID
jgi:hypothetical protein